MKIQLNGKPHDIADSTSVAALLEQLQLRAEVVAVEVNLDVIPRDTRAQRMLKEGDQVEVVKFVGGGS